MKTLSGESFITPRRLGKLKQQMLLLPASVADGKGQDFSLYGEVFKVDRYRRIMYAMFLNPKTLETFSVELPFDHPRLLWFKYIPPPPTPIKIPTPRLVVEPTPPPEEKKVVEKKEEETTETQAIVVAAPIVPKKVVWPAMDPSEAIREAKLAAETIKNRDIVQARKQVGFTHRSTFIPFPSFLPSFLHPLICLFTPYFLPSCMCTAIISNTPSPPSVDTPSSLYPFSFLSYFLTFLFSFLLSFSYTFRSQRSRTIWIAWANHVLSNPIPSCTAP